MLKMTVHETVADYAHAAKAFLECDPIQNNMPLGILAQLLLDATFLPERFLMTFSVNERIVGSAHLTPPHSLALVV